ncbi:ABC transporter ATP-binding protein [Proteiniclasticum sp.]|uniref:ABC transporter ATP-binding protein n=1 Tax=Proteiniclasticum sp. TaxID=2053595 RepID=UPI0028A02298|nr:ABC transporter ATP-binding protein [Proteiniclasticum sp.]
MPYNGMRGNRGYLTEEEKKDTPKISVTFLKRVFSYLMPYRGYLILSLAAIAVSSLFGILPTIITGKIIDEGLLKGDLNRLVMLLLISLLVLIISNLIGVLESYLNVLIAENITSDMRSRMYKHLQKLSQRFFTGTKQGDILTRMTSDISGVQSVITGTFSNIIKNIVTLTIALITMFSKDPVLAVVGMVIVPLFILPTKKAGKVRWSLTMESRKHSDEISQILNETLSVSGQALSKLFVKEEFEFNKYDAANKKMVKLNIRESMAGRWFRVVMAVFTSMGPMLIYLFGGILIIKYGRSSLSIGDITVMVALLGRIYGPINSLFNIQVDLIRSMAIFSRIFEYFDIPVEVAEREDALEPEKCLGQLSFKAVSFHYEENQPILNQLSFDLSMGKTVAIVGPSGAGKSTVSNLIPRLYDVTEGAITLDGHDIRDLKLSYLRSNIGVVSQDTYLFHGTIRENLLYAREEADMEEIMDACREANIHDFIESLPKGYETMVGNRGMKLSGGQKQRISIARIILRKPAIIIFDEATSSLDTLSEKLIQEAIKPLLKKSASLVIAHRLSTIYEADEILVMESGEIRERGSHESLLHLGGIYKSLYDIQFESLKDLEEAI